MNNRQLWKVFPELVNKVRRDHRNFRALVGGGHDFAHALMAAQYCLQIADGQLATLGWIAGICHNADRFFEKLEWKKREENFTAFMDEYLDSAHISGDDKGLILEAVKNHSRKPVPNDLPLTIVLMDADKLANLGGLLVIRSAQFQPTLPPIDPVHLFDYPPGCNYRNPGSICRDIASSLEWETPGWFRIPRAIELAKPMFAELRRFNDGIVQQFRDVGLLPYPFPQDFELKK